jgi:hypothetical protein
MPSCRLGVHSSFAIGKYRLITEFYSFAEWHMETEWNKWEVKLEVQWRVGDEVRLSASA